MSSVANGLIMSTIFKRISAAKPSGKMTSTPLTSVDLMNSPGTLRMVVVVIVAICLRYSLSVMREDGLPIALHVHHGPTFSRRFVKALI
jgi:hypothetical protein